MKVVGTIVVVETFLAEVDVDDLDKAGDALHAAYHRGKAKPAGKQSTATAVCHVMPEPSIEEIAEKAYRDRFLGEGGGDPNVTPK